METKVDKRTKEYRDTAVVQSGMDEMSAGANFDICNDPHGIGCTNAHPPDETFRTRPEPCYGCVWRNV